MAKHFANCVSIDLEIAYGIWALGESERLLAWFSERSDRNLGVAGAADYYY